MKKVLLLWMLIFLSSFVGLHKFYVSVTQIDYNEEQKSLQIISRIFIDDIEEVLQERYNESIVLISEKENPKVEEYLKKYLHQKLKIEVNGEQVFFTFIGKEYDNDLLLCYLEVENVTSLNSVKISNQVLMDLFEEQQNIVHVKNGNIRKSLILEKGKDEQELKFSE